MWPVDAVVGENGAFWMSYDRGDRKMRSGFAKTEEDRARDRLRLAELKTRILAEVPGAGIASDQDYRIADLAIDFREDVAPLSDASVARIVALFESAGATAKVSSIHVKRLVRQLRQADHDPAVPIRGLRDRPGPGQRDLRLRR